MHAYVNHLTQWNAHVEGALRGGKNVKALLAFCPLANYKACLRVEARFNHESLNTYLDDCGPHDEIVPTAASVREILRFRTSCAWDRTYTKVQQY